MLCTSSEVAKNADRSRRRVGHSPLPLSPRIFCIRRAFRSLWILAGYRRQCANLRWVIGGFLSTDSHKVPKTAEKTRSSKIYLRQSAQDGRDFSSFALSQRIFYGYFEIPPTTCVWIFKRYSAVSTSGTYGNNGRGLVGLFKLPAFESEGCAPDSQPSLSCLPALRPPSPRLEPHRGRQRSC